MKNPVWPSCVTPAGTSNELDVQNEWEENTHTHSWVQTFELLGRTSDYQTIASDVLVLENSSYGTENIRLDSRLRVDISMHKRTEHERKTELYGY